MDRIRIVQYGVGAMGSNMVRLLETKPEVEVVGAIDHDPGKAGRDLGEVAGLDRRTGVTVRSDPREVLGAVPADLVLHATTAFVEEAFAPIMEALDARCRVVTICQELFFPIGATVPRARAIDARARQVGVAVTAVGINPGFVMDIVPIVCSVPCWRIDRVSVRRVVDFAPYGPDEMRHIGAGLTVAAFEKGVRDGTIGHIGLLETAAMVAHCLDLGVDELRQTKTPIVTRAGRTSPFIVIEADRVCGFRQNVTGLRQGEPVLDFRMIGIVSPNPGEDGEEMGDYTRIDGMPSVDIRIREEIAQRGGLGTAGVAVNMIPRVIEAQPGFHTMNRLPIPHLWGGSAEPLPIERVTRF